MPTGDCTLPACSDIRAVVAALGHESCVLVGHDWGGAISWLTAAMYPEVVRWVFATAGAW